MYYGNVFFVSEDKFEVNKEVFEGSYFLIVSGVKFIFLFIKGEEYFIYSDEFLELDELL